MSTVLLTWFDDTVVQLQEDLVSRARGKSCPTAAPQLVVTSLPRDGGRELALRPWRHGLRPSVCARNDDRS
eukprot:9223152-Lingulodinium_polyedra.AAC.1